MRIFYILIIFLLTAPAMGQVRVVAGEHGSFTRVVVANFEGNSPVISRNDASVMVEIGAVDAQALRGTFDFIDRSRLASATIEGETLQLDVGCECSVHWTLLPNRRLVLDIVPEGRSPEIVSAVSAPLEIGNPGEQNIDLGASVESRDVEAERDELSLQPQLLSALAEGAQFAAIDVEDAAIALRERLATAGRSGVLELVERQGDLARPSPDQTLLRFRESAAEADREDCVVFPNIPQFAEPSVGHHNAQVELAHMLGEFDRPVPERLTSVVEAYVSLGLSVEARQVLTSFSMTDVRLNWLVNVLDGQAILGLDDVEWCSGPADMWRIAAGNVDNAAQVRSGLDQLAETAPYFRRVIGHLIADQLLEAGLEDQFAQVLALLERDGQDPTARDEYYSAELLVMTGRVDEAIDDLTRIATDHGRSHPRALSRLLELHISTGKATPSGVMLEAASMARQLANTQPGRELLSLMISIHAAQGAPDIAFDEIERAERDGLLPPTELQRLAAQSLLAAQHGGAAFVEAVLIAKNRLGIDPQSRAARLHAATGLLEMGLPTPAVEILEPILATEPTDGVVQALVRQARADGSARLRPESVEIAQLPSDGAESAELSVPLAEDQRPSGSDLVRNDLLNETEQLRERLQSLFRAPNN